VDPYTSDLCESSSRSAKGFRFRASEVFTRLVISVFLFLPHDAMHKRGNCCHAVSVRPSVMFVDNVKTNRHNLRIFLPFGIHGILVITYQTGWRHSDGNPPPLTGRRMQVGHRQKSRFWSNS